MTKAMTEMRHILAHGTKVQADLPSASLEQTNQFQPIQEREVHEHVWFVPIAATTTNQAQFKQGLKVKLQQKLQVKQIPPRDPS
jgi:hypothetical protein